MSNFVEVKASEQSIRQRKLVYGVGINDANYVTQPTVNGRRATCPYYRKWINVLVRCHSTKFQTRCHTYIGATVCDEWLTFSVFKTWMIKQEWEGLELDKDIIKPGNKHYSPETCCFVPQALNALLNDNSATRGDHPKGVCFDKRSGKYLTQCNYKGKNKSLGYYKTVSAASLRYRLFKSQLVRRLAEEQEDGRIKAGMINHAKIILYKKGETV